MVRVCLLRHTLFIYKKIVSGFFENHCADTSSVIFDMNSASTIKKIFPYPLTLKFILGFDCFRCPKANKK